MVSGLVLLTNKLFHFNYVVAFRYIIVWTSLAQTVKLVHYIRSKREEKKNKALIMNIFLLSQVWGEFVNLLRSFESRSILCEVSISW